MGTVVAEALTPAPCRAWIGTTTLTTWSQSMYQSDRDSRNEHRNFQGREGRHDRDEDRGRYGASDRGFSSDSNRRFEGADRQQYNQQYDDARHYDRAFEGQSRDDDRGRYFQQGREGRGQLYGMRQGGGQQYGMAQGGGQQHGMGQQRDYGWSPNERDGQGSWDRFEGNMQQGGGRFGGPSFGGGSGPSRDWGQGFGGSGRSEPSFWDETKREARDGWEQLKGAFSGKGPKGYMRSDDRIREDVCDRLAWHPDVDASEIEVTVSSGEVTLSGKVNHRRAKRMAEDVADEVQGVKEVTNQLRVEQTGTSSKSSSTYGSSTSASGNGDSGRSTHESASTRAATR